LLRCGGSLIGGTGVGALCGMPACLALGHFPACLFWDTMLCGISASASCLYTKHHGPSYMLYAMDDLERGGCLCAAYAKDTLVRGGRLSMCPCLYTYIFCLFLIPTCCLNPFNGHHNQLAPYPFECCLYFSNPFIPFGGGGNSNSIFPTSHVFYT
jgi:hypothetical protein